MSELPSNPEIPPRSPTTINTDLLGRLEMLIRYLENEGIDEEETFKMFGTNKLTAEILIDSAISTYVKSFSEVLAEDDEQ